MTVRETMAALETWLAENAPALSGLFNPPALEADVFGFESRFALILPPEIRNFYSIHDGEADGSDGIFGCRRWLPLSVVSEEIELIGSSGIVPLFRSGGGDLLYVKGHDAANPDGRLYERWHEVPEQADVVGESLGAFLAGFVDELREGRYLYLPDELAALIDRREL